MQIIIPTILGSGWSSASVAISCENCTGGRIFFGKLFAFEHLNSTNELRHALLVSLLRAFWINVLVFRAPDRSYTASASLFTALPTLRPSCAPAHSQDVVDLIFLSVRILFSFRRIWGHWCLSYDFLCDDNWCETSGLLNFLSKLNI